jgi:hypothetical protein
MKKLFTILSVAITMSAQAQNWQEWTQQKKTQIKYLVNQIAALQIYSDYVEKGYAIAKDGLNAISSIKSGDFLLHEAYFNSLKTVNPKIKSYWKLADIIALQIKIVQSYRKEKDAIRQCNQFTEDEINYCNKVFTHLLDGCSEIIDQLILITTDGGTEMKDDERIKRIDALYRDIRNKYVFVQYFSNEANVLATERIVEMGDVKTSKALLDIR